MLKAKFFTPADAVRISKEVSDNRRAGRELDLSNLAPGNARLVRETKYDWEKIREAMSNRSQ